MWCCHNLSSHKLRVFADSFFCATQRPIEIQIPIKSLSLSFPWQDSTAGLFISSAERERERKAEELINSLKYIIKYGSNWKLLKKKSQERRHFHFVTLGTEYYNQCNIIASANKQSLAKASHFASSILWVRVEFVYCLEKIYIIYNRI